MFYCVRFSTILTIYLSEKLFSLVNIVFVPYLSPLLQLFCFVVVVLIFFVEYSVDSVGGARRFARIFFSPTIVMQ